MKPRAENVREAQRLRVEGFTAREIAARLGVSRSAAASWLNDPDLSKQRARRKRYQGTCKDCGAATDGSNGRDAAPEFCADCAPDAHRVWTREAVITAIRTWAAEYGEPPRSTDWINARNGYPSAASCHWKPSSPFKTWADAIEAAGFPRPFVGKYERRGLRGAGWRVRQVMDELTAAGRPLRCRDLVSPSEHNRYAATWSALQSLVNRGLAQKHGDYYSPASATVLASQKGSTK